MKQLFIFLGAFSVSAIHSQTLSEATHQPDIGDVAKIRQLDTAAFSAGLPNGTSGANSYWDFSAAQALNSSTLTNNYSSPSTFTHGALYPGSTIVQDLPGNMFTYFRFSTTPTVQTELVGIHRPDIAISFSNAGTVIQYPASLGFSVTDEIAGSYSLGALSGPAEGETQTVADGTGTLVLGPGAVFNDVIRVKSVQTLTLTQGTVTGQLNQVVYNYYSASQKFPIINISYISMSMGTSPPSVTAGMFANADNYATVGLGEHQASGRGLRVFPNPASDLIHIESGAPVSKATIYNVAGQKVLAKENADVINVGSLEGGVYLLEVASASGTALRRIVVAR